MFGSLIGAVGNLVGGLFGKSSADANREAQERMAAQNIALQKEFAQNAVQWKVEDAAKAGVHPLFALGANTTSFSPVSIGSSADNSMAEGIAQAGQNVGRAFDSYSNREQKALTLEGARLDIERKKIDNEVARQALVSAVAVNNQPGNAKGLGGAASTSSGTPFDFVGPELPNITTAKPAEALSSNPAQRSAEAGPPDPEIKWYATPTGFAAGKSKSASEAYEDDPYGNFGFNIRNRILPSISASALGTPPPWNAPEGYTWAYSPLKQEWYYAKDFMTPVRDAARDYNRRTFGDDAVRRFRPLGY